MCKWRILIALASLSFLGGSEATAQEVFRNVSADKLEGILKELNINYKKVPGKTEDVSFYDYERNNFKIRLHNYGGKDLWIDALFNDRMTLEEINRWNVRAKFSRAVLIKDKETNKETISLESQIDCQGGITDNIIKSFINRFDGELRDFSKFLAR